MAETTTPAIPPPPPAMQLDTAVLHETLIRLAKGMLAAYEAWFCRRTGRTLKKDWMDHLATAKEMTGRFNEQLSRETTATESPTSPRA